MAAEKRKGKEAMFHIEYPERRDFFTWIEMGCLCRALGFPGDIIQKQVDDEIHIEDNGISLQQLQKMVELKLLHQPFHRSFNMHTADWNLCVFNKAIKLQQHFVLNFEELHNIRVAYATYEASDMKGLKLDNRTLLRTLKMCHRTISPLKLMHRVKHMRSKLEEAGRIQLYEFFDLIMWCDYVESLHKAELITNTEGKENDLFHLVDFETLLSHQDERRARALDERYLAEEWDFGRERLGSKHMFKGEVVFTEGRIKQTQTQKNKYRHLKTEVSQSQRRVYRAHAGSIRARPISAPVLSMYATPRDAVRSGATSAGDVYKSVQRRLHSAPSRVSKVDVTDRPHIEEYVRAQTPCVVSSKELDDVQLKIETLQFDIITLGSRCEIKLEEEKDFYIPAYKDRPPSQDNSDALDEPPKVKEAHWTPEIIQNLAYPHRHAFPHHAETCDARMRGWNKTQKRGRHRILTAPTYISSPQAHLLAKQRSSALDPVAYMRPDYVVRYTPKREIQKDAGRRVTRPATAPTTSPRAKQVKRVGIRSAGSVRTPWDSSDIAHYDETYFNACDHGENYFKKSAESTDKPGLKTQESSSEQSARARIQDGERASKDAADQHAVAGASYHRGLPSFQTNQPEQSFGFDSSSLQTQAANKTYPSPSTVVQQDPPDCEQTFRSVASASYKRQSRAKTVEVGLMGTISLLESIQEHQDLEDRVSDSGKSSPRDAELLTNVKKQTDNGGTRRPGYASNEGEETESAGALTKEVLEQLARQLSEANNGSSRITITKKPPVPPYMPRQDFGNGEAKDGVKLKSEKTFKRQLSWDDRNIRHGNTKNQENRDSSRHVPNGYVERETFNPLAHAAIDTVNSTNGCMHKGVNGTPDSQSGDSRDADPTPLTSVTVTIKDKTHHMTNTSMRAHQGHSDVIGLEEANEGCYSPAFSSSSPPYSTSTSKRVVSPVKQSNRTKIKKENESVKNQIQNGGNNGFDNHIPQLINSNNSSQKQTTSSTSGSAAQLQDPLSLRKNSAENTGDTNRHTQSSGSENKVTPSYGDWKKSIQFATGTMDPQESSARRTLQTQTSTEQLLRPNDFNLDKETPRRFMFNKVTTNRLLRRVGNEISPELMNRIKTGDAGLKVL